MSYIVILATTYRDAVTRSSPDTQHLRIKINIIESKPMLLLHLPCVTSDFTLPSVSQYIIRLAYLLMRAVYLTNRLIKTIYLHSQPLRILIALITFNVQLMICLHF